MTELQKTNVFNMAILSAFIISDSVEQFEARVEDIFTRLGCQDYE